MSVALLLPMFTSLALAPCVTVAVLWSSPLVPGPIVPRTVSVSALPAPGDSLAFANSTVPPSVPFVPQVPSPVTAQVALTPVIAAGTGSSMRKPAAVDGPALVTMIV